MFFNLLSYYFSLHLFVISSSNNSPRLLGLGQDSEGSGQDDPEVNTFLLSSFSF